MKSSEEMRQYLQALIGWGLERPSMYGGSPQGADAVFWYWRLIWAQLTDRVSDFYGALSPCERYDEEGIVIADLSPQMTCDPDAYRAVISFWQCVDQRLGIDYPAGTEFILGGNSD